MFNNFFTFKWGGHLVEIMQRICKLASAVKWIFVQIGHHTIRPPSVVDLKMVLKTTIEFVWTTLLSFDPKFVLIYWVYEQSTELSNQEKIPFRHQSIWLKEFFKANWKKKTQDLQKSNAPREGIYHYIDIQTCLLAYWQSPSSQR